MTTEQKIEQLIEIGNTLQINLNTPKGEALLSAIQALTAIDNIRTEIEQNAYPIVHGVNNHELGMTLYGILQVIDKYKAESEVSK